MLSREQLTAKILATAGLKYTHSSYNRKNNHLYRLNIKDQELAVLSEFPVGVLRYLFFSGNLFREQRGAFLENLRGSFQEARDWLVANDIGESNFTALVTEQHVKKLLRRKNLDALVVWKLLAEIILSEATSASAIEAPRKPRVKKPTKAKPTTVRKKTDEPASELPPFIQTLYQDLYRDSYGWQKDALAAWLNQKGRGIIVAATGTGKTFVGGSAIEQRLEAGKTSVVIAPTQALVTQWRNELEERFRGKVGSAQTQTDAPFSNGALIEVFTNNLLGHESEVMINRILTQFPKTLLVADECHHLGSEKLGQRILNRKWHYALGLTATLERSDGNIDAIKSGIGAICFTYGIADGIRDGSLAEFDLVEYAIKLSPAARIEYDELDEKYKRAIIRFRKVHDPEWNLSGGQLIAKANAVNDPLGGMLLGARKKRLEFVASETGKIDALKSLELHKCRPRPRALLFAETREMTAAASSAASKGAFQVAAIDHKKSAAERDAVLRDFSAGKIAGIAGPKILDEGINLPSADLGIILARTFSGVQMVQRFGRVLRRTQDKHRATIIVMYFKDTFEDLSHRESETSDVWSELRQAARNHLTVSGETLQQILDRLD